MDVITQKDTTQEGAVISRKVNRMFIEVLIGVDESKEKQLFEVLAELDKQRNRSLKAKNRVAIFWHVRKGNQTAEEQLEFMKEKAYCKYMVIAPEDLNFHDHYLVELVTKIQKFEESYLWMKQNNISHQKPKVQAQPQVEEAKIIPIREGIETKVEEPKAKRSTKTKKSATSQSTK